MFAKWNWKKIVKELLSSLVLLFVISLIMNYIRKPNVNENIYALVLKDITDKKIEMNSFKKKPLVVHFWATWCPTCKLEASNIEAISKEYNVVSIAVNSGSDRELLDYMQKHDLSYTVVNDKEGVLAKKFDVSAYPTTLIYDKNGKLKFSEVGYSTTLGLQARVELSN